MKPPSEVKSSHIRLTSHPGSRRPARFPMRWGAATAAERGPAVATVNAGGDRNAIGAHGGSYSIYRALAISSALGRATAAERGPVIATVNARRPTATRSARMAAPIRSTARSPSPRGRWTRRRGPDLQDTSPVCEIGPHPQWGDPGKIVSLDPWGHRVAQDFGDLIAEGIDIRPSIAITRARLTLPEIQARDRRRAARGGRRDRPRGRRRLGHQDRDRSGLVAARRRRAVRGRARASLRRCLFEQTGGMYPELVTRPDLSASSCRRSAA